MKDKLFIFLVVLLIVSIGFRISKSNSVAATDDCEVSKTIAVEIKGLVKNPGVYYFEEGKRLVDLINASGGLLPDASVDCLNQTTQLIDKMTVLIGSNQDVRKQYTPTDETKIIEPTEKEEKVIEVCTCEYVTVEVDTTEVTSEDLVSLNEGSIDQLSSLPGIGQSKAKAIIEYRNENPFNDISEIVNVKGIGDATFENIKHLIKK